MVELLPSLPQEWFACIGSLDLAIPGNIEALYMTRLPEDSVRSEHRWL